MLLPVVPLWAVHGGAGAAGAGLVNGVLLATTVLVQLAVPALLRRWGHPAVMVCGLALMAVGAVLHVASDSLAWTLGCSAVRGAGFGVLTVTGSAAVGHLAPPALRGRMIGTYGLAVAVPNLLLLPAGVAVVEQVGFVPVLLVGAIPAFGLVAAVRLGRLVEQVAPAPPPPAAPTATGPAPPRPGLLRAVAAPTTVLLASTLAGGALITFLPQLTGAGIAGLALLLMGAAAAAARYGAGHLADRGVRTGEAWLGPLLLLTAAGTAACAWGARDDGIPGWLLLGSLLCGAGYGALQNLTLASAFHRAGPDRVAGTSSVWNIGFDGGTALGAVLVGALAAVWGFPLALAVAAGGCVLALGAVGIRRPPTPS